MTSFTAIYQKKIREADLTPDPAQERAVQVLDQVYRQMGAGLSSGVGLWHRVKSVFGRTITSPKSETEYQGAYLYGTVGRGKSMVMDLFFEFVPMTKKRRVHFHTFMLELHDDLHKRRKARKTKSKDKPQNKSHRIDADILKFADQVADQAQLLCFDEFQVRDVADAMILGRLFTALFDRGVFVIATSNTSPDDLYLGGLQRDRFLPFIALLKDRLNIVVFEDGRDYRLARARAVGVWFLTEDPHTTENLDRVFDRLTDGAEIGKMTLKTQGRQIKIPKYARHTAWFSFKDLCVEAKSVADYVEITKNFHTLIVEDVPCQNDEQPNYMHRFIHLVDTCYERGTRLVISAQSEVEKLYQGKEPAFDRTVSRLIEMQSESWWHDKTT